MTEAYNASYNLNLLGRIAFVTEGQSLVTCRLEAVITKALLTFMMRSRKFSERFLQLIAMVARKG
jgi:hypothetical protein